jgi:hypothetical protein
MREQLLDRMIRIYGFEHPIVVSFACECEKYKGDANWDHILQVLVESHEEFPQLGEDEDED